MSALKSFYLGLRHPGMFSISTKLEGGPLDAPTNKQEALEFTMYDRGRNCSDALKIGKLVLVCLFSGGRKSVDEDSESEDYMSL